MVTMFDTIAWLSDESYWHNWSLILVLKMSLRGKPGGTAVLPSQQINFAGDGFFLFKICFFKVFLKVLQ